MNELNDKELLEQLNAIKKDSEDIQIPDSLSPENMMKRIEQMEQKESGCFEERRNNNKGSIIKRMGKAIKGNRFLQSGIAAALVVAILTGAMLITMDKGNSYPTEQYYNMIKLPTDDEEDITVLNGYSALHNYLVVENTKEKNYSLFEKFKELISDIGFGSASEDSVDSELSGSMNSAVQEGDYSDTNTRTESVKEADVVKTDGEYIYFLEKSSGKGAAGVYLAVYKAAGKNTEAVCKVSLNEAITSVIEDEEYRDKYNLVNKTYELMLYDDKLVVITECDEKTMVLIFDISNREDVAHINTLFVEGQYDSCKLVDGYLYVFAKKSIRVDFHEHKDKLSEDEAKELLGVNTSQGIVNSEDVYVTTSECHDAYVVIGTVDMKKPDEFKQVKSILGSNSNGVLYMSQHNIYYISSVENDKEALKELDDSSKEERIVVSSTSEIISLSYKDGEVLPKAKAYIEGNISDVFDVDEYKGYLRLALRVSKTECLYNRQEIKYYNGEKWVIEDSWMADDLDSYTLERYSALCILDSNLEEVGSIPKLKEEEEVYGVRFDGDIGYVVTYRRMDPLFSIDLSDPTNPKVLGELKIPGFSEYLHKWDDNTLIGIGRDDGWNIKISTFDITDKTNVYERDICVLDGIYYTDALYDHRAVFISPEKNLLGFYCTDNELYNVYTYIDGRLTEVISQEIRFGENNGYHYINTRGLYIGDYIYIVNEKEGIYIYDINTFERVR